MTPAERSGPPRGPGRPPKLDHDRIADAVLAEGFAGLTVEGIATALGVGTATLYRYVATRGELMALAWDRAIVGAAWPDTDAAWDQLLAAHATTLWQLSAAHPGAISELSAGPIPPAMVRLYDDLAVALVRRGFTATDAVLAVDSVIDLTIDHRLGVERLAAASTGQLTLRDELGATWSAPGDGDSEEQRLVRSAMVDAIEADPLEWFDRKLDLVLAGIGATLGLDRSPRPVVRR